MKRLLVIVDMVNGFVHFGPLADKKILKTVPAIKKAIVDQKKCNGEIVCFRDAHDEDDEEFNLYPVHCLKGEEESMLIPELKIFEGDFFDIEKSTTNGFNEPRFRRFIAKHNYDEVVVTGCCTDICIEDFASSLKDYFKLKKLDTKILVPRDAVFTFDAPKHNAILCNEQALERLQAKGVEVLDNIASCNERE